MLGDAVMGALSRASATLQQQNVSVAVMGGVAISIWKHARATKDVDLLVGASAEEIQTLLRPLAAAGIHPKRLPPLIEIDGVHIVQFTCQPVEAMLDVRIDFLLAECPFQKQALARAIPALLPPPNESLRVLACEDLILFKLLAGRMIDRADVAYLLRENRAALDLTQLRTRTKELSLESELLDIWQQTFPDERPPFASES